MRLTQQQYQALLVVLRSKEGAVEDTHANQINTITIELSQPGKPFVSSCNINDKNVWIFDSHYRKFANLRAKLARKNFAR